MHRVCFVSVFSVCPCPSHDPLYTSPFDVIETLSVYVSLTVGSGIFQPIYSSLRTRAWYRMAAATNEQNGERRSPTYFAPLKTFTFLTICWHQQLSLLNASTQSKSFSISISKTQVMRMLRPRNCLNVALRAHRLPRIISDCFIFVDMINLCKQEASPM
jgi:hypothetical protein